MEQLTPNLALFDNAKPELKKILSSGRSLPNPICLSTLSRLLELQLSSRGAKGDVATHGHLKTLLSELSKGQLTDLARLECFVLKAFASMEYHGLYIDSEKWQHEIELEKKSNLNLKKELLTLLSTPGDINLFGESELNLESHESLKQAFKLKTNLELKSLNHEILKNLNHPAANLLIQYRESQKLIQTYGDNFLEQINPKTGRIHATFEPLGTSTGRVSCHTPNIQNLPSDPRFQACLGAPKGKTLVKADYAACELRILADFSGDELFLKAFEEDQDLHAQVAKSLFGSEGYRPQAKAINFGIIYGMGAASLSRALKTSEDKARDLLSKYFQKHPKIKNYLETCVNQAYQNKYAQTKLGRRLYLDTSQDISRIAKNMPIQGTAAEITKLAMIRIHERLESEFNQAFLVNMIHDELVVECLEEDAKAIAKLLQVEMESAQRELTPRVKPKVEI